MNFSEWSENKTFTLVGGEISGTEGVAASLRATVIKDDGSTTPGRFGGPMKTLLDPGTLVRNLEFKGIGLDGQKTYSIEASFNDGKKWGRYEIYEKPVLE